MSTKKDKDFKADVMKRTEEILNAAYLNIVKMEDTRRNLKDGLRYRATPKMAIQAIERTIGRRFTCEEIGWFYISMHQAIDGIDERGCRRVYDNMLFDVVFNSEMTTIIQFLD